MRLASGRREGTYTNVKQEFPQENFGLFLAIDGFELDVLVCTPALEDLRMSESHASVSLVLGCIAYAEMY